MKYVIIGNGVAGIQAVESIRRLDSTASITLIGDEKELPYCRPMISLLLEGAITAEKLVIRTADFYKKRNIEPVLGERVTRIDPDSRIVTVGGSSNGGRALSISYDKLLIASGADARPLKVDGNGLKNIFYMRKHSHVQAMLKSINAPQKINNTVVLGGGLVGFKAAYGLMKRGLKVTMLITSDYPLAMQVDETAGRLIRDELMAHGLDVRLGIEVTAFDGQSRLKTAHLSDGGTIECDMAIIGKGVLPAVSFIPKDKIEVDLGIRVNPYLETSVPGIYAAGDVAELTDIARKIPWVNAIWPEAAGQGRVAGMNMAGRKVDYKGSLSRNVMRIFDLDIMTCGVVNPPNVSAYAQFSHFEPRRKLYRKLVFKKDTLVGVVMVNAIENGGVLVSLIQSEMPIRIEKRKLLDTYFNVKQLLV